MGSTDSAPEGADEGAPTAAGIFISYRRNHDTDRAGRLTDALEAEFGPDRVFYDHDSISAGRRWREVIRLGLDRSAVVLVLIGVGFMEDLNRHASSGDDVYVEEIAMALSAGIPLIPVLLGDAEMPDPEDLPAEIKLLPEIQAITLRSDHSWKPMLKDFIESVLRPMLAATPVADLSAPDRVPTTEGPSGHGGRRPVAPPPSRVPDRSRASVRSDATRIEAAPGAVVFASQGELWVLEGDDTMAHVRDVDGRSAAVCGTGLAIDHIIASPDGTVVLVAGSNYARALAVDPAGKVDLWGERFGWPAGAVPLSLWKHDGATLDLLVRMDGEVEQMRALLSWAPRCQRVAASQPSVAVGVLGPAGVIGSLASGGFVGHSDLVPSGSELKGLDLASAEGREVLAALCEGPRGLELVVAVDEGGATRRSTTIVPSSSMGPVVARPLGGDGAPRMVGVRDPDGVAVWPIDEVIG